MAAGTFWVIVFYGTPKGDWGLWHLFAPHTWSWFRKTGYKHCVAIREVPGGYILVDWHLHGLDIRNITPNEMLKMQATYNRLNAKAWQIRAVQTRMPYMGVYTCATFIARLCGLRGPFWLPYRLSRALVRRGAVPFCPVRWRVIDG